MMEWFVTRPDSVVQEAEYKRLLGYPGQHELAGRARELADWARDWHREHGQPWIYARQTDHVELTGEGLKVNGTQFSSKRLQAQLAAARAHSLMVVAVSAGRQGEELARELWQAGKPDEYFFMEMYGAAVVEHLVATAAGRICAWADQAGLAVLPHYSPGYSGWEAAEQVKLWEVIRRNNGHGFPGELQVMETGMLRPKKSLLAVFGLTRDVENARRLANMVPCENCSLPACQFRRTPYAQVLPQLEDVRGLQPARPPDPLARIGRTPSLRPDATYSINPRALRKWGQQRLKMRLLADKSVEARFRYEGTTCSNLGRPLEYDYHIELGSSEEGYRILSASCAPAPGDTGHAAMCEYINDPERLARNIASERPLVGRPLDEVLSWERTYSPAGCYCDPDSRRHKWGLVFEVIHHALAQQEQQAG